MVPLVLVPGMMCDARLFAPQIQALSGAHTLHLATIGGQDTVAALARDILASAPPVFALAGLSMGGIVAMEILRQAPERVERLALLDTNPLAEAEEVRARRIGQVAQVRAGQLDAVMAEHMFPHYLADRADPAGLLAICAQMARALGPNVFVRQSAALAARPDQTATLARFSGSALVLMGADDRLCPRHRHELLHSLMPQSTFVAIDDAGHLPTLEKPEHTTAALKAWLES